MTDQSPAQKAARAFNDRYELCGPFDDDWVEQCLAAALEDVADQVVPEQKPWHRTSDASAAKHQVRCELLAIAAELRGQDQPSSEEP